MADALNFIACLGPIIAASLLLMAGAVMAVPILVAARAVCKRRRSLRLWHIYMEGSHRPVTSLHSLLKPKRRTEVVRRVA